MIIEITEKYQIGLGQKYKFITFKPLLLEVMNQCPLFDQLVTDYVWWNTFRKKKIDMNLKVPREEDKKSVQISKENVWLSSM